MAHVGAVEIARRIGHARRVVRVAARRRPAGDRPPRRIDRAGRDASRRPQWNRALSALSPETAAGLACGDGSLEDRRRVAALVARVEVRRRRALAHEAQIHHRGALPDISQRPAVAVALVEPGVDGDAHSGTGRQDRFGQRRGLAPVALRVAVDLGRVDLDEADRLAAPQHDRIAVGHVIDDAGARCRERRGRAQQKQEKRDDWEASGHEAVTLTLGRQLRGARIVITRAEAPPAPTARMRTLRRPVRGARKVTLTTYELPRCDAVEKTCPRTSSEAVNCAALLQRTNTTT